MTVHPHVRGDNVRHPGLNPPIPRFTPTCVGTIAGSLRSGALRPVHPHVRGDNDGIEVDDELDAGSPPRAWGQFPSGGRRSVSWRFTPTCVGTIVLQSTWTFAPPVHPHVRGDN